MEESEDMAADQIDRIALDLIRDLIKEEVVRTNCSFYDESFLSASFSSVAELNQIDKVTFTAVPAKSQPSIVTSAAREMNDEEEKKETRHVQEEFAEIESINDTFELPSYIDEIETNESSAAKIPKKPKNLVKKKKNLQSSVEESLLFHMYKTVLHQFLNFYDKQNTRNVASFKGILNGLKNNSL